MEFTRQIAELLYQRKILLVHNSKPPSDSEYGWLKLPSTLNVIQDIHIEERVGLYGSRYIASIGAPLGHGLCNIGSFSYSYSALPPGLRVGRYCSISNGLSFLDSHHPTNLLTTSAMTFRPHNELWADILREAEIAGVGNWHIYDHLSFPVIGNDVWIGRDVVLAMGITIGDGAIIAANSVVTKDVAPYSLIAGNPGECKKTRFHNETVQRLLASRWWDKDPVAIARIFRSGLERSLDYLENHGESIPPFIPKFVTFDGNGVRTDN